MSIWTKAFRRRVPDPPTPADHGILARLVEEMEFCKTQEPPNKIEYQEACARWSRVLKSALGLPLD